MFELRSRQARCLWSEREEKTARRAQGPFSWWGPGRHTRHPSGIHEGESTDAGNRSITRARAKQGSGSCGAGEQAGIGTEAEAEARGEAANGIVTAATSQRAALTVAAAGSTAGTAKHAGALAGSSTNQYSIALAFLSAARHFLALTSPPLRA